MDQYKKVGISLKSLQEKLWHWYCNVDYKVLLILPILLVVLSVGIIGHTIATTGTFVYKDVSLQGGMTVTLPLDQALEPTETQAKLQSLFPEHDINVRGFGIGAQGLIIDSDVDVNNQEQVDRFLAGIEQALSINLDNVDYGVEFFGSSLGQSFFADSIKVLLIAFGLMALVIFGYFRNFIPSLAIVLAVVGDMLVALAVMNLFQIPLGVAGIAAFLMLIGYSVDTDILLTVRVLKRREGSLNERIASSIQTGLTQTGTSLVAVLVALAFTSSEVISQIMFILAVGLVADIAFTWLQNVALLRYYFAKKEQADG